MEEASNYKNLPNENYRRRKQRSEAMLNAGIEPVKDGFNEYWIPSQCEKAKRYKVTIKDKWYSCECPDNHEGNLCKHILLLKTYFAIKLKAKEQKVEVSHPCPECDSHKLQKDGTRKTIMGKKQKWLCLDCGKRFVNEPVSKIKGNADTIITALDLYMKGVSYRGIADSVRQFYGLKVTHVTIMNWVTAYMEKINAYVNGLRPAVGDTWKADEQFIKVKGKQEYVWNVLDAETRFLLASNESPTRGYNDARQTFQIAKEVAGKKALTIVTDGAFNYKNAVRKEFATYANPRPHKRYVSIRNQECQNNDLERFHGTFRQRDKVMRGFKGNQHEYARSFQTYYNFVKEHGALGMTPAQKAGIAEKGEWRELLKQSIE